MARFTLAACFEMRGEEMGLGGRGGMGMGGARHELLQARSMANARDAPERVAVGNFRLPLHLPQIITSNLAPAADYYKQAKLGTEKEGMLPPPSERCKPRRIETSALYPFLADIRVE